jgi:hypothetical protein
MEKEIDEKKASLLLTGTLLTLEATAATDNEMFDSLDNKQKHIILAAVAKGIIARKIKQNFWHYHTLEAICNILKKNVLVEMSLDIQEIRPQILKVYPDLNKKWTEAIKRLFKEVISIQNPSAFPKFNDIIFHECRGYLRGLRDGRENI